jgi:hypothetical protein
MKQKTFVGRSPKMGFVRDLPKQGMVITDAFLKQTEDGEEEYLRIKGSVSGTFMTSASSVSGMAQLNHQSVWDEKGNVPAKFELGKRYQLRTDKEYAISAGSLVCLL